MRPGFSRSIATALSSTIFSAITAPQHPRASVSKPVSIKPDTLPIGEGVAKNLLMGIGLVLTVLLITRGWRAALVARVILPLCTLTSMIALFLRSRYSTCRPTGLVLALGLLVDGPDCHDR
ncbi:MAG: hypothetical protein CM15mP103_09700 [Gammaproteobacteria bacterium]|nr:MAG: hypothetical protein CM15mP103_09700 [Gammaproteobacteria bacterium]